jgi:hypothetical protein
LNFSNVYANIFYFRKISKNTKITSDSAFCARIRQAVHINGVDGVEVVVSGLARRWRWMLIGS